MPAVQQYLVESRRERVIADGPDNLRLAEMRVRRYDAEAQALTDEEWIVTLPLTAHEREDDWQPGKYVVVGAWFLTTHARRVTPEDEVEETSQP